MAWCIIREFSPVLQVFGKGGRGWQKNSNTKDEVLSLGRYRMERKEYEEGEEEDVINFLHYVNKNCALTRRKSQNVI